MDKRIQEYIDKGLSKRTAYRRLNGKIRHCNTCTCLEVDNLEERAKDIDLKKIKPDKGFERCSKHEGSYKTTCGCE